MRAGAPDHDGRGQAFDRRIDPKPSSATNPAITAATIATAPSTPHPRQAQSRQAPGTADQPIALGVAEPTPLCGLTATGPAAPRQCRSRVHLRRRDTRPEEIAATIGQT